MQKIKAAIVGYGNIGKYLLEALQSSPDFELTGIVRRDPQGVQPVELRPYRVVASVKELPQTEVAILCTPSRSTQKYAAEMLNLGIHTVDSFDVHSDIWDVKQKLDKIAKENKRVSVISAGWDPGSDSVVRALMEASVPKGITYTNFGPGMSMGHTVAVKAVPGVKAALSMTIPLGSGVHRRMVYIELEKGYDFNKVASAIKADAY
ncbi:MAG: diaminopimelate dehydrogenase, partial [Bacteroidales bacterium]|nr:diaminopimelate dehydrogenase [Bacteroidales bacterium]